MSSTKPTEPVEPFSFPVDFQRSILRLLLCDRSAMSSLRGALSSSYFTEESYRWIAQAAFDIFDEANATPTQPSLLQEAVAECPGSLDPEEIEAEVRALYEDGLPEDSIYVQGKVVDFAKSRRLLAAAAEAEEMIGAGNYTGWVQKVNEASTVGEVEVGQDLDLAADAKSVLYTLDELYAGAIPTRVAGDVVDKHLDGGGLCPGEMGIVIAMPGGHKTNFLVNVGIGALSQGRRVAHFAFEGGRNKVALRYYCAVTRRSKSQVCLDQHGTLTQFQEWVKGTGGSLKLSYFPKETCTVAMLESKLKRWEAFAGWRPELLIVDYPTVMKPAHDFDNTLRLQIASMYRGVQRVAGSWGVPTWVAQQAGREAIPVMKSGGFINMNNAAETFEPCRDADVIVTNNQTDEEKADGIVRLFGAKMREGEGGWKETVRIDEERSLFLPLTESLPVYDEPPARKRAKPPEPDDV